MKRLVITLMAMAMVSGLSIGNIQAKTENATQSPLTVNIEKDANKANALETFVNNLVETADSNSQVTCDSASSFGAVGEKWAKEMKAGELRLVQIVESALEDGKSQKVQMVYGYKNSKKDNFLWNYYEGFVLTVYRPLDDGSMIQIFSKNDAGQNPAVSTYCYSSKEDMPHFEIALVDDLDVEKGKLSLKYNDRYNSETSSRICFNSQENLENFLSSYISAFGEGVHEDYSGKVMLTEAF